MQTNQQVTLSGKAGSNAGIYRGYSTRIETPLWGHRLIGVTQVEEWPNGTLVVAAIVDGDHAGEPFWGIQPYDSQTVVLTQSLPPSISDEEGQFFLEYANQGLTFEDDPEFSRNHAADENYPWCV
ncbi:MAG: hypothetical protein P4L74_01270 [Candidatus Doudnabacteria bacterium]|nr:hypothetical protein [Candidatus Doudnabacteria bacterium]